MNDKETLADWLSYTKLWNRTGIGAIVAGVGLATAAKPGAVTWGFAALLALAGAVVRFWSAGIIAKNKQLATTGPYAWVRNPLYSGSLLVGLAFLLLNANPYFIVPAVIGTVFIYIRTIQSEERKLTELFGDTYIAYMKAVPAIIPWKGKVGITGGGEVSYSLEQSIKNREYNGVFGTLGMLVLFYVYWHWIPEPLFRTGCAVLVAGYLVVRGVTTTLKTRPLILQRKAELRAKASAGETATETAPAKKAPAKKAPAKKTAAKKAPAKKPPKTGEKPPEA